MTPEQALALLDQLCSKVALTREVNQQVIIAVNTLQEAIKPKSDDG